MTGTDDTKAIESVIQSYLDGLHEGDADKIASRLSSDQRADQHRGQRRTGDHAARRLAGQRPEQAVAEATGPAAPRSGAVDRPRRSDNGLRQAEMRNSAALLHRPALAVEDRWPLADRAKGFYDRTAGMIPPGTRRMGRAQRNPSPGSLKMMGFAALYPSYKPRSNTDLPASGARLKRPARRNMEGDPR